MNYRNTIPDKVKVLPKTGTSKRYIRSLEYEVLANLTLQHFQKDGEADFEQLLSIPRTNRVPGLSEEYGKKRMHKLITLILKEFCYAIPLPKSKKLTETKINVCACDLMLAAYEDYLALEDLIVFFERAKQGKYGSFKKMLTHYSIMEKLEQYRQERHAAYVKIKENQEAEQKALGPVERTSPEPTSIKQLFDQTGNGIPLKKIS
jgi:hypothetical protein